MELDKLAIQALLERINDRMLDLKNTSIQEVCPIGIIDFDKWEWPQGVGLYGMWKYCCTTGSQKYLNFIKQWYEHRISDGLPEKNVNTMAPMLTLAFLAEKTGRKDWLDLCNEWAQWVMDEMPRTQEGGLQHIVSGENNEQQMWDDTLFMTVLFLAKMAELTDNEEMRREAEYQFLLHAKYLQDPITGLWYHGWCFEGRHNFAKAFWARGNCWITAGIPEYLELGTPSPAVRRYLIGILANQVKTLSRLQADSGMWHTVLDDPGSYEESSATAGFAYGILKGIHMGLLSDIYQPVAEKAVAGVLACIGEDGVVGNASYGTGMGWDLDHYRNIPVCPMAYGQSLPVMMLGEVLLGQEV